MYCADALPGHGPFVLALCRAGAGKGRAC
ncbi:MAG TPA: hypothetical protein DEB15_04445, partial [Pusillimonas sp.]|nr:hypothetical protein [Pusillimonas sp.]